jgi:hypothetical protein
MPALIVTPKFVWQRIILTLPRKSPYFGHERCNGCRRKEDGSQLSPSTIAHICMVLVDAVSNNDPESRVYRGIPAIARGAKRHQRTVMATLGHLQTVGLLDQVRRGGGRGVARGASSLYSLTVPDPQLLALGGVDPEILAQLEGDVAESHARAAPAASWFTKPA